MSKEEIERIENEINVKTNLLFALADIQEGLIVDIESHAMSLNSYQFNLKHKVGTIKRVTGELRAFVNKTFSKKADQNELFGITSDELKELLFDVVSKKECPICQSKEVFSATLVHSKCKKCETKFTN